MLIARIGKRIRGCFDRHRFLRYGIVGGISTLTYTLVASLLVTKLDIYRAAIGGYLVACCCSYFGHNIWTFPGRQGTQTKKMLRFALVSLTGVVLSLCVPALMILTWHFSATHAYFVTSIIIPIFNFFCYDKFVFKKPTRFHTLC